MVKLIGFEAGETHRTRGTYADGGNDPKYDVQYPLMTWGWDREECKRQIAAAGLPVPEKSACFFCPSSKRQEIVELTLHEPSLIRKALEIEHGYRKGKHWRDASHQKGASTTVGLGRKFTWASVVEQTLASLPKVQKELF